ncbi:unnamed protein product [Paramecium sonneborni]|uniref:Uncharacterized protein n=1 Tax=Paramecium sonneborni TaxID=65129 RepID=A0A8S1PFZ7_9CILI|nr:unnamed protein product [Paramecium sonneborni]
MQQNKNFLTGQLQRIILNKQSQIDEIKQIQRNNSLIYKLKEQVNPPQRNNNFSLRNSMKNIESIIRVDTNKKIQSPVIVIQNRKHFVSSKNSRKSNQSVNQEHDPLITRVRKSIEFGQRIIINRPSRVSTILMDEEQEKEQSKIITQKDPVSFTDWVERIYGKEWFY